MNWQPEARHWLCGVPSAGLIGLLWGGKGDGSRSRAATEGIATSGDEERSRNRSAQGGLGVRAVERAAMRVKASTCRKCKEIGKEIGRLDSRLDG